MLSKLTSDEKDTLIMTLVEKINELEAQLGQNSTNSSKPPSSDGMDKPAPKSLRKKSGLKPGGKKGHPGHGHKIEREPDYEIDVEPKKCDKCGTPLEKSDLRQAGTRYKEELHKTKTVLIRFNIKKGICRKCGAEVAAEIPPELRSTYQYGGEIRALVAILAEYANVGEHKISKIMRDLLCCTMSPGTVENIIKELGQKSEKIGETIKRELLKAKVLHFDETGIRINGKLSWVQAAANTEYTLITASHQRGRGGIEKNGILPGYTGIAVHDCWSPYFCYTLCLHAICCAHLLRELQWIIDYKGQKWAKEMQELLLKMKKTVEEYKGKGKEELSKYYCARFKAKYERILKNGREENPVNERKKKSKAENLLKRFEKYEEEISRFAHDFNVPFDNNQAERDFRNVKGKMKIAGGFRTDSGADDFAKIFSVISTIVKQGGSVIKTIGDIFAHKLPAFAIATV